MVQAPRITRELNPFRSCLCNFFQDFFHQSENELDIRPGVNRDRFSGWLNQNWRANTQVVSKCWIVSSWSHCGQRSPLFCRRSASLWCVVIWSMQYKVTVTSYLCYHSYTCVFRIEIVKEGAEWSCFINISIKGLVFMLFSFNIGYSRSTCWPNCCCFWCWLCIRYVDGRCKWYYFLQFCLLHLFCIWFSTSFVNRRYIYRWNSEIYYDFNECPWTCDVLGSFAYI